MTLDDKQWCHVYTPAGKYGGLVYVAAFTRKRLLDKGYRLQPAASPKL